MAPSDLKHFFFGLVARYVRPCEIRDTIIITGCGRSGTTWLAELLRRLPEYKFLNEPLIPGGSPAAADFGLPASPYDELYLGPDEENPRFQRFMRSILEGRLGPSGLWKFEADNRWLQLVEFLQRDKLIVKFTRALRMTHWIANHFESRGILLLIRHPCAVVHSMLGHGGWHPDNLQREQFDFRESVLCSLPSRFEQEFRPRIDQVSEPYEMMAHLWSIDYALSLMKHPETGHPWLLVPYERLVRQGRRELERIGAALEARNYVSQIAGGLDSPSRSASASLETTDVETQLTKWKRNLSQEQIDRILNIVHRYGLNFYDHGIEPDYGELERFQQFSRTAAPNEEERNSGS